MKKLILRLWCICLCGAVLFAGTFGQNALPVSAVTVTRAEVVDWAKNKVGTSLDYYKGDITTQPYQCVDLIYYYYDYLGVSPGGGNACDFAYNALPAGWQRITVTDGFIPEAGDIAVWKTNASGNSDCGTYTTGWAGHVGIVTAPDVVNPHGFFAVNQNFLQTPYCTENWFNLGAIDCVIRPNFSNTPALSVLETIEHDYRVTIPANHQLICYETPISQTTWKTITRENSHHLYCTKKCVLSDGSVRFFFRSGDGYDLYFTLLSSMSVEEEHNYRYSFADPTCTSAGHYTTSCTNCSYEEIEVISALGHDAGDWEITKMATCSIIGIRQKKCSRCDKVVEREAIPTNGLHLLSSWIVAEEATCTEDGRKEERCTQCSEVLNAELIPATGEHSFGEWVITETPTCDTEGTRTRTCTTCEHYETAILPAGGHSFTPWGLEAAPTCTAAGSQERCCSVCSHRETTSLPATGHSFGEWQEVTDTLNIRICETCNHFEQHSTAALLGDVDSDGKINSTDARLVLQYAVKVVDESVLSLSLADVDRNGNIDSTDARLILQYTVKKIDKFPIAD